MKKKLFLFISVVAIACVIAMALVSCGDYAPVATENNNSTVSESVTNTSTLTSGSTKQLQLLKSEYKFTQEQMLSRIKAEYLIANNGYKDSDKVVVMMALSGQSLIDAYLESYTTAFNSVGDYAKSVDGIAKANEISAEQDEIIERLTEEGVIGEVMYHYSTIFNGIAVEIEYGNLEKLENTAGVSYVMLSETYNLPQSTKSDASAIENAVEIYPTGIYDSSSAIDKNGNKITGKGTAVAILDSGFDCSHSVFSHMPECTDDELLINKEDVASFLSTTSNNASKYTEGLELYQVYVNEKIPFAYDYADKDYDVFPYDSEHGTHVAGIIGGQDSTITGIAVDTQLVLMKVFPDLDSGGKTEDILLALEDAVLLNVDAINMSLGSSCGFSREEDNDYLNKVYDSIANAGISLIAAASNDYSAGYGGAQGNTNKVTNPDSGTVGSPSTYQAALSVASISGTKSKYIYANDSQVVFYKESNSVSGKENKFYEELYEQLRKNGYTEEQLSGDVTLEYVTVPGIGSKINFSSIDVKGKIALIKRGSNTFEEKALQAKNAGAIACIIYNNIDGDILMSMGKTDHIPTISISMSDGTELAKHATGTMVFNINDSQAGPFMSDFSSWGPTPDLKLKPEITAHGGNILSAVPNGQYDELSGTSMATPNLCGIVILIRSYLKDRYPDKTWSEINSLANQLLMSTATIIRNEEGNPYSPRKQGAGLASMRNVVSTDAYLSVDGSDRVKLELGDDPDRSGVYEMEFNVVNFGEKSLSYNFDFVGMTETVSSSDETFVAETPYILGGDVKLEYVDGEGTINGKLITVAAGKEVKLKVTYTLTDADKQYIDSKFIYGMYVEGFVKLIPTDEESIELSAPFLAFYGDWTEAPMFDKDYYEVESEAHDKSIDDEDKIKADYLATTPYGSYYYNYLIPLGTYLYDIDEDLYDAIPASRDHAAVSNFLGSIDGISAVYAGLLRGAKTMNFTITDKVTGEVVYEHVDYNAQKAHSSGGSPVPYYEYLKVKSLTAGLVNNVQYEFKMQGLLDYGDGGVNTNMRNTFSIDFYMDNEAPVIKSAVYEKKYDKSKKKDRYYVTLTVYDNHYVQSVYPIIFTSSSSYTTLTDNPIPVYSEKGKDTQIKIEITDYLSDAYYDAIMENGLSFAIDDYALNTNIYICQLPGTDGEFKFTKTGEEDGSDLIILSIEEGDVVDLTDYLSSTDVNIDADKDYLKHLVWSTSNEKVVTVNEGQIVGIKEGRATVAVREQMNSNQAVLIINVKAKGAGGSLAPAVDEISTAKIKEARFAYFDTKFAYSRAAQTSEIGSTGSRTFVNSLSGGISFYPGEKVQLAYDVEPWYVKDKYAVTYESTNPQIAVVDQDGTVTALKEGSTSIILNIEGSNITPRISVTVKNPFVIEGRVLIAYKGLGGKVVIPDDEGILYIGSFAFSLYSTDNSIELTDDDYDANKIPTGNTTITSVVIPEGVTEIQKYAFYNCTGLREVAIPNDVKFIRENAFYNCTKLERVVYEKTLATNSQSKTYLNRYVYDDNGNFVFADGETPSSLTGTKVEVIGANAFAKCVNLDNMDLANVYAIGVRAFDGCTSLTHADLVQLRNTGKEAFRGCTALESVEMGENTKLSYAMFAKSGIREVELYVKDTDIPEFCFALCPNLTSVTIHNDVVNIGKGAFSECHGLETVAILGDVDTIGEQTFYDSDKLTTLTLPNGTTNIAANAFRDCDKLTTLKFAAKTEIVDITGAIFYKTGVTDFVVDENNAHYAVTEGMLTSKDGTKIIFAPVGNSFGDTYVIKDSFKAIGASAFAGANFKEVVFDGAISIGAYAFGYCSNLEKVTFAATTGTVIGASAFNGNTALTTVENLEYVTDVKELAFAGSGVKSAVIAENAVYGNGVFMGSKLQEVVIGKNAQFGLSAFRSCTSLKSVTMPADGGVVFGAMCFAGDTSLFSIDLTKVGNGEIARETFYGCYKLASVDLTNITTIGDYAFSDCRNLGKVTTADGLEVIGEGAFSRNTENGGAPTFTEIYLPETLKKIGVGAFIGCQGLKEVTIPASLADANNKYSFGNKAEEEGEDRDFRYGDTLFMMCTALESVTLPEGCKYVGSYMFYGCTSLITIENTSKVTEIDEMAFSKTKLSSLSLSVGAFDSVKTVGYGAFASSKLGGYVNMPNVEEVGDYAFQSATFISFNAPKLRIIGEAAFQLNENLKKFDLGKNIEDIGLMPFYGCTALEVITLGGEETAETDSGYAVVDEGILYTMMKSGAYMLNSIPYAMNVSYLEIIEGTERIETYAANENPTISYVVCPDSLKLIGNYAFYKCNALTTVEFKSVQAPSLEDSYNSNITLSETDPGYDAIHNVFDVFGLELYYCTFVDIVGKKDPIDMVLPANDDISGYDSLVYEVYFGTVENSRRSDYVAMEAELNTFIESAQKIMELDAVTLANETLINQAVTAYKALSQRGTDYGYTKDEWYIMIGAVNEAKATLNNLKIKTATYKAQQIQKRVNALPATFEIGDLAMLKALISDVNSLDIRNKALLDLTKYNAFVDSYNAYCKALVAELEPFSGIGA